MFKYHRITFVAIWAVFITLPATAQEKKVQEDQFAKIGSMDVAVRTNLLKENVPPVLPEKYLQVSNDKASAFEPFNLMDTKEVVGLTKTYLLIILLFKQMEILVLQQQFLKCFCKVIIETGWEVTKYTCCLLYQRPGQKVKLKGSLPEEVLRLI